MSHCQWVETCDWRRLHCNVVIVVGNEVTSDGEYWQATYSSLQTVYESAKGAQAIYVDITLLFYELVTFNLETS